MLLCRASELAATLPFGLPVVYRYHLTADEGLIIRAPKGAEKYATPPRTPSVRSPAMGAAYQGEAGSVGKQRDPREAPEVP